MFMLVCFAIATHHGAQGTLWRAAGSDLRFTMTTAPKSTGAIAASIDSTRPVILPRSLKPRAKFAHPFKPTVKTLDAKNDERFLHCEDREKQIATLDFDTDIVGVKTDDHGGCVRECSDAHGDPRLWSVMLILQNSANTISHY